MGIYADIQADLKEEMDGCLSDAVATLTVTESVSSNVYNPVAGSGGVSNTPVVNDMKCIIVDSASSDEIDPDSDSSKYDLSVMVLDSHRTTTLKLGLSAAVRGINYIVSGYDIDPAGATHTLDLRRL